MVAIQLAVSAALAALAVPLTPDTAAGHGYHVRVTVLGRAGNPDAPAEAVPVQVRFGRLPGGSADDLAPITGVSLEVRDGDGTVVAVPVRADVDPGNRVHLAFRFSTRRDLLARARLVIDEDGPRGPRRFTAALGAFLEDR